MTASGKFLNLLKLLFAENKQVKQTNDQAKN